MLVISRIKQDCKLLVSLGFTLIACSVFCSAQTKFLFPSNTTEFTVVFPQTPKIETIFTAGKSGKSAQTFYKDSLLKAEILDIDETEASRVARLTDEEFSQILMAYATSNGMSYPTITKVRSPFGRAAKLRGYKTVSGQPVTFESHWIYGKRQAIVMLVAGASSGFPQKEASAFLASLRSSIKDEKTTFIASQYLVYSDEKFLFTLFYPKEWVRLTPTHATTRFKIAKDDGAYFTDFNIVAGYFPSLRNISPETFVTQYSSNPQLVVSTVKQLDPEARVIEQGKIYINNRAAYFSKSHVTLSNFNEVRNVTVYQIQTIGNGNVYTLTFRSLTNEFDDNYPVFQAIARSFIVQPGTLRTLKRPSGNR